MADQHPAVTFLLAAHGRAERLAQASAGGRWVVAERADCDCCDVVRSETGGLVTTADLDDAPLVAEHANPTAVLARVAAERELLTDLQAERHLVVDGDCWYTCAAATEEHDDGESCRDLPEGSPCDCGRDKRVDRRIAMLAKAWGWAAQHG